MSDTDDPILVRLEAVRIGFGARTLLEAADLGVRSGTVTVIAGPNGCGKTTLLRTLLGLRAPEAGRVHGPRGRIGYVPQTALEIPALPVQAREVVAMGLDPAPRGETGPRIRGALERVGAVHLLHRPIDRLSGGERQRIWIARALVADPALLALDEPTSHLDPDTREQLLELLLDLARRDRVGVVVVSHDPDWHQRPGLELHRIEWGRLIGPAAPHPPAP